jgi:hypothetical protein
MTKNILFSERVNPKGQKAGFEICFVTAGLSGKGNLVSWLLGKFGSLVHQSSFSASWVSFLAQDNLENALFYSFLGERVNIYEGYRSKIGIFATSGKGGFLEVNQNRRRSPFASPLADFGSPEA